MLRTAVAFIGYEDSVSPYWSHALQLWVMSLFPKAALNMIVFGMHAGIRAKALKKKEGNKQS
jgi:17beta-estradiol 17-dehydrogenase / very-long-chain 3-oxoacyl-CoA reductase